MPAQPLVSELRVRSCDVDSFGHVNNAVYLNYLEGARNDYLLERGVVFADFARWNAGPVLTSAHLEFRAAARTDDPLVISGLMHSQGRSRFRIEHTIIRKTDQRTICVAVLDFAFVTLDTGKPCRMPEPFARAFDLARP